MKQKVLSEIRDAILSDTSDTGGICGYANIKGCLDTHATIMISGCYRASIPNFLLNGFLPDTHGVDANYTPTMHNILGFFTNAVEDNNGLWIEAVFDSSHRAQECRAKIQQRLNAGRNTGLSIGFEITDSFLIYPQDYETELPKYLAAEYMKQGMSDAQQFPFVEIVTEVDLVETSITVIPSNKASLISQVRSRGLGANSDRYIRQTSKPLNFTTSMKEEEIRVAKKISAASHEDLSKHIDDMDDAHEKLSDHLKDMADDHRTATKLMKDCGRACRDMREKLDTIRGAAKEDNDADDKKEKEDKRSTDIDAIYKALEVIENKLSANTTKVKN